MANLKKNFSDALEFVNNKVCIVRCDLNLPIVDNKVTDFTRLDEIIPTLEKLISRNGKIILISHLGRPKGKVDENLSLEIMIPHIEERLKRSITFCPEQILSSETAEKIKKLPPKGVILLENIRFYKQEEENDIKFSSKISEYGDIYINESFSTCHRSHASITGIPSFLPSFPGKLFEQEIKNLNVITKDLSQSRSVVILGGAKISTKVAIIESLIKKFNKVLIGGAMANTFIASQGIEIGRSFNEPKMQEKALTIIRKYGDKILLPEDAVISNSENPENHRSVDIKKIKSTDSIYDIGPKTRKRFYNEIIQCEKLLWNGPLGFFEKKPFNNGTNYIASVIKSQKSTKFFSAAGGGDTISALKQSGYIEDFSFVSTGGGAFLEFIEGKSLPGIEILNK